MIVENLPDLLEIGFNWSCAHGRLKVIVGGIFISFELMNEVFFVIEMV